MHDDGKTPESPQWEGKADYNSAWLVTPGGVTKSVYDAADILTELEAKVTRLEAALREAEAKAALADECYRRWDSDEEVSMHWRNSDTWQAGWLKRYDALQQPKAGA